MLLFGLRLSLLLALFLIPARLSQADPVRVAYEESPPHAQTNADGAVEGFSIGLLSALADETGLTLQFIPSTSQSRSLEMMENGTVDVTALMALTAERRARGLPTTAIGEFDLMAFTRHDSDLAAPEDLRGLRIGAVAGSFALTEAGKIPLARVMEFPRTDSMIMPLLTGEIDAVISPREVMQSRLRRAGVEGRISALSAALITIPHGFIVTPSRPELQARLNAALGKALSSGTVNRLQEQWFGPAVSPSGSAVFWAILGMTAACFLALGVMAVRLVGYRRETRRLLHSNTGNDLLLRALDEVEGSIIIFDSEMRAVHRNTGVAKAFPSLVPLVDARIDLRSLLQRAYFDNVLASDRTPEDLQKYLDGVIETTLAGQDNTRTVTTRSGKVYEARDFRLGKDHFASIRVDVTSHDQQRQIIEDQAAELEKANEQLQAFSAVAAHDLRAPLRGISSLLEFAIEDVEEAGVKLPESTRELLEEVTIQADRMMKLIEDLLIYARAGSAAGERQEFDPITQLQSAIQLIGKPPGFQVDLPETAPTLFADPAAFQAVMRNLINNAIKHHDRKTGLVKVETGHVNGVAQVIVSDDGPGIPEEFRDIVFEPFKRLTNNAHGSGLGLAYIKKAVESWGGQVTIDAVEPRGSRFVVTIPTPENPQA